MSRLPDDFLLNFILFFEKNNKNIKQQPFNKQDMMAIYCYGQAVSGIVFYNHQL